MGPDNNAIEEVKRDAIRTTLRHFRDAEDDLAFEPIVPLQQVQKDLIAENTAGAQPQVSAVAQDTTEVASKKESK